MGGYGRKSVGWRLPRGVGVRVARGEMRRVGVRRGGAVVAGTPFSGVVLWWQGPLWPPSHRNSWLTPLWYGGWATKGIAD